MFDKNSYAILTDLYELTMIQGYYYNNLNTKAVFEMFFRKQPFEGGYSVFAGLEPFLKSLEKIKFNNNILSYLDSLKLFKKEFLAFLKNFRFKGDIFSVSEGTIVFPNEPLIRVEGTLIETQLIESLLLNFINFQTLIATKTSRIVEQAKSKAVLEFGLRRAQGADGALSATRAAFIGGTTATSNTLAGKIFDIPVSGTMAHSWVMSFNSELEAFENYKNLYPEKCVLLVDTFDTLKSGIPNAVKIFNKLKKENKNNLMAIRIDSGDLEYLSKKARDIFDINNLEDVKIFVSSDLDEWIINQLESSHSPIDSYGVGTRLVTGHDTSALTGVYKIVAKKEMNNFEPCIKISNQSEKITNPGIKNIMRFYNNENQMIADLLFDTKELERLNKKVKNNEPITFNHPATNYEGFVLKDYVYSKILLNPVMENGKICAQLPSLSKIQDYHQKELLKLDETYKRLLNPHRFKVSLSDQLKNTKTNLIHKIKNKLYL